VVAFLLISLSISTCPHGQGCSAGGAELAAWRKEMTWGKRSMDWTPSMAIVYCAEPLASDQVFLTGCLEEHGSWMIFLRGLYYSIHDVCKSHPKYLTDTMV